ncbi:formylglycine-generating enzyme family protein [Halioxenophilus sp. WMMB6]|uniref:formylglycine-generating enzyme family protein n=1 Tax=Halioxenophilus sp. WMMB6 TaxID=3073815 RepID=UPI00295F3E52|nr:formylglycine-generating enzyme family protein [Halioxenophilus sp. WMMB6]
MFRKQKKVLLYYLLVALASAFAEAATTNPNSPDQNSSGLNPSDFNPSDPNPSAPNPSAPNPSDQRLCQNYSGLPEPEGEHPGMVHLAGGTFVMGNDAGHKDHGTGNFQPFYEERSEMAVTVKPFWIDRHEVTNAQFAQFVAETGYVTLAERKPKKEWFPPGFPEEEMVAGSAVFIAPEEPPRMDDISAWWHFIPGADWRHPQGPASNIEGRMSHPVVHVAYEDAAAYAEWAGRSLPTEAQWEYAARGGLAHATYTWGDNFRPDGQWMANTWQGQFPTENKGSDGYIGSAPVGCFPANNYGLFDMAGNVWEIVRDPYQPFHASDAGEQMVQPGQHVIKGGSYLCTPTYCMRYRPSARQPQEYTLTTSHIGFRTVINEW